MQSRARKRTWAGLAVVSVLCVGCASTAVTTDSDPSAEFERYRTYAMRPGPVAVEEVAAAPDAVVQDRITAALDDQLADKGLEPAKQGEPDVVVTFMARAATETELVEVVGEPPSRQGYGYTPIFPVETEQGALIVDVIDGSTGKLVWRAVAKAEDQDFGSPEFIRNAVREALDEFPPD